MFPSNILWVENFNKYYVRSGGTLCALMPFYENLIFKEVICLYIIRKSF